MNTSDLSLRHPNPEAKPISVEMLRDNFVYKDGALYRKTLIKASRGTVDINRVSYPIGRVIYTFHYGDIPEGMRVHRIDGNPHNNCIENFELRPIVK